MVVPKMAHMTRHMGKEELAVTHTCGHIAPLLSMIVDPNSFRANTFLKSMWSI